MRIKHTLMSVVTTGALTLVSSSALAVLTPTWSNAVTDVNNANFNEGTLTFERISAGCIEIVNEADGYYHDHGGDPREFIMEVRVDNEWTLAYSAMTAGNEEDNFLSDVPQVSFAAGLVDAVRLRSDVPVNQFFHDVSGEMQFDLTSGGECGDAANTARFHVTKTFSDGNDAEVDVMLSCNSGLPLEQTFTIAGGGPGVTFVLTEIPEPGADCEVTESGGPAGYTTVLNGGEGCEWADVTGGFFSCEITNEADDATYTVVKDWVQEGTGGDIINAVADVTIKCDAMIDGYYPNGGALKTVNAPELIPLPIDVWYDGEYWYKSGDLGDGGMLEASVDVTQGPATCSASEEILQSGVESIAEGCGEVRLGPGASHTCTFTNTVFFEGIPTLSQYGLALLALLMLGVGFVGMRRFV